MKPRKIVLIGAGGHAQACIDVIESEGNYEIEGLVGTRDEVGKFINGYKVIGCDQDLAELSKDFKCAVIAIGQIQSPELRIKAFERAVELGFKMATIISPTAYVSTRANVGAGTIIMHGAIVNCGARIGANCIINSRALIEHGSVISDHCHISTGAIINGEVSIGKGSFIGSGAVIRERVALGNFSLVGMANRVLENLSEKNYSDGKVSP